MLELHIPSAEIAAELWSAIDDTGDPNAAYVRVICNPVEIVGKRNYMPRSRRLAPRSLQSGHLESKFAARSGKILTAEVLLHAQQRR